jgi:hypothetical protein
MVSLIASEHRLELGQVEQLQLIRSLEEAVEAFGSDLGGKVERGARDRRDWDPVLEGTIGGDEGL